MGDPREPTDPRILQALRDGVRERMGYPAAVGLPELREAIAALGRPRFGVDTRPGHARDPDPRLEGGDLLVRPGRPRPGRRPRHGDPDRARLSGLRTRRQFAGARVEVLPLLEAERLPARSRRRRRDDMAAHRARLGQLPEQPDRRVRAARFYEHLAALAREHDFVVASDEAYTELWFEEPPRLGAAARRIGRTWWCSTPCRSARR